jgi:protein SCO1/2
VAGFIFTSCGSICPAMTENMQTVSNTFKNDSNIVLLSFTVTPWIDSVARLKQYTTAKNITNPNWHFLTGAKSSIYQLARTSSFAEESKGFTKNSTEFLHTEHIILADKNKNIRGIYHGTLRLEMEQLIKDIRQLQAE